MSIGFGKSYQKAGLNRLGAYLSVSKTKGPPADRNVCPTTASRNACSTTAGRNACPTTAGYNDCSTSADKNGCSAKPNEIWRRYTGIFEGVELKPFERKRGLGILARRIRERLARGRSTPLPRPLSPLARRGENADAPAAISAATEVATTKRL